MTTQQNLHEKDKAEKYQVLSQRTGEYAIKAFWVVIVVSILWVLSLVMQAQFPYIYDKFNMARLYDAMMLMILVRMLCLMRWIYVVHIDLREIFVEYRIRPLLASFLFFLYLSAIGEAIVFGYFIHRIREDASRMLLANSLTKWFLPYYCAGFAIGYVSEFFPPQEPGRLLLIGSAWGILDVLHGILSINLIRATGRIIKKISENG